MSRNRFDVIVVGGGPAGAACAERLAHGGARVLLLQEPRRHEKPCAGCLTRTAWHDAGRPDGVGATPLHEAAFEVRGGHRIDLPTHGDAVLVDRQRFDQRLLQRAADAGAVLRHRRAMRVRRTRGRWSVDLSDAECSAPCLVGADGCDSIVRRAVAGRFHPVDVAFGVAVRPQWDDLHPGAGRPGAAHAVFYPPRAQPGAGRGRTHGYAYLFGAAERPAVGAWARGDGRRAVTLLKAFLASLWRKPDAPPTCRILGRATPCIRSDAFLSRPVAGDTWILVGDAAGHVNPVTGEGIAYALRGGRHAADAILQGRPKSYDRCWRADYGPLLRWGRRLVRVHERLGILDGWIARAHSSRPMAEWLLDLAFVRKSYRTCFATGVLRGAPSLLGA